MFLKSPDELHSKIIPNGSNTEMLAIDNASDPTFFAASGYQEF